MTGMVAPAKGESLAEAGERIRAACPVQGVTATDEECRIRAELVAATLAARGVRAGAHRWHTAQLADGRVVGVSASSVEKAELELTIWWEHRCHWVIADPELRTFHAYFPRGKRSAANADRRFPLARPRHPRDEFAPAPSLLEGIWTPGPAPTGPGLA